ncbi:cellulase family glycosylhydrolase [Mycobacterium sp. AMU20-3851]|uniref:GH39 family glycosyl hydrolase n=1 Tax=Mycobacterium sp. AMU20-3851 TaxID=3122055 RepID=UPI0037551A95
MWSCVRRPIRGIASRVVIGVTAAAVVATTGSHLSVPEVKRVASYEVTNVAAVDDSSTAVGISDSNIYFADDLNEVLARLSLTASLGVKNIRLLVPWWQIQTQDPLGQPVDWESDLNWAKLDTIVAEADRLGLGILGVLQWTPAWATDGPPGSGHPSDPQYLADFAGAVASRYLNKITAYEVWNEPNFVLFWNPVDPVEYTEMLKATYTALKAVSPDITVVGAVVGPGITIGEWTKSPVEFVAAMYAAGAHGYFDAISFHPYDFVTKFSEQEANMLSPLLQIQQIRAMMDAHLQPGEEQLKIWITEYGLPTSQVSAAVQLEFMRDILTAWQSIAGAGPVFLYSIQDDPDAAGDERFFGIFDQFGNPKDAEALAQLKKLIRCLQEGCAPGNPTNPVSALLQAIQQVVTQILSVVPNLVASVVQAVTNLIGSVLGGLTGALTGTPAASGASIGASLRAMSATSDLEADAAAAEAAAPESGAAPAPEVPAEPVAEEVSVGAEVVAAEVPVTEYVVVADEAVAEVPVTDEVVTEEVVTEVPVTEEVVTEVPVTEDVVTEVPVTEDVVTEVPVSEVPVSDDTVTEDEVVEETPTDTVVDAPVADDVPATDPVTTDDTEDTTGTVGDVAPSDPPADISGAFEGSAPELGQDSPSKSTRSVTTAGPRLRTAGVPKASADHDGPRRSEVRAAGTAATERRESAARRVSAE